MTATTFDAFVESVVRLAHRRAHPTRTRAVHATRRDQVPVRVDDRDRDHEARLARRRGDRVERAHRGSLERLAHDASSSPAGNALLIDLYFAAASMIKHLVNDKMNARAETVDIFMQIIPPGSRSGKHRQLAEECLYVLEGRGYDIHVDCDVEITDTYHWKPQDDERRYEWEAGDMIYIPPNTISQHFNADPGRPVRLVSATNRIYKYGGLGDLEQIEDAPEYDPVVVLDDETVLRYLEKAAVV